MSEENHVNSNIKFLRKQCGYTQEQLSELINVSPSTYKRYERNGNLSLTLSTTIQLATIFNVSVNNLIFYDYSNENTATINLRSHSRKDSDFSFFEGKQYFLYYLSEKVKDKLKYGTLKFDNKINSNKLYLHGTLVIHHIYDCKLVIDGDSVIIYGTGKKCLQRVVIFLHFPDFGEGRDISYRNGMGILIHKDTHANLSAQRICIVNNKIENKEKEESLLRYLNEGYDNGRIRITREEDSKFNQWALKELIESILAEKFVG